MLIFSLSILASINSLFPFFINFSPVFINSFKEYIPSVLVDYVESNFPQDLKLSENIDKNIENQLCNIGFNKCN
jgi:hypothetical protein